MPIVADGVHTEICHSHFSTRLFLVRGGIPIPFMKINAASGPRLRFNLGRSTLAKPRTENARWRGFAGARAAPSAATAAVHRSAGSLGAHQLKLKYRISISTGRILEMHERAYGLSAHPFTKERKTRRRHRRPAEPH
jgi:hypothetical protein